MLTTWLLDIWITNFILWQENLNSDGLQFYQYQPPLILTHWTQKKITAYDVGNPGPSLGQTQKCDRVKPVNEIGRWICHPRQYVQWTMDMSPQSICAVDDGYVTPVNMCSGRWICQPRQYVQWTMDMSPQAICTVDDGYVTPGNMCSGRWICHPS